MIPIIFGFFLTLVAYLLAKPLNKKLPQIPVIVFGMCFVITLLLLLTFRLSNLLPRLALFPIFQPTRRRGISYSVFFLKKKKKRQHTP